MHHLMHLIGWAVDHLALWAVVGGLVVALSWHEKRQLLDSILRDRDEDRPW